MSREAAMSPAEFLAIERTAEFRHEFVDGEIVERAVSNRWHNLIVGNLVARIGDQSDGRPCEVYAVDLRVWVPGARFFAYPDVAVVRGEPRFLDGESDTLLNPTLIIEVFSPSTEGADRGRKFERYRRLESLCEYVLIDQERVHVEDWMRRGESWFLSESDRIEGSLRLDSIGCAIPLREIYDRVRLGEAEADGAG